MYNIKQIKIIYEKIEKLNNLQKLKYSLDETEKNILYLKAKNDDNIMVFIKVFGNITELYLYLNGIIDGYEYYYYKN